MSIRIDAHHTAQLKRAPVPAPVKVEPPRIRVDLHGNTVVRAGGKNLFDVELRSRPAQQLPASHVAEDSGVRIRHRVENALRLLFAGEPKAAVNAGYDKIELSQNLVGIV